MNFRSLASLLALALLLQGCGIFGGKDLDRTPSADPNTGIEFNEEGGVPIVNDYKGQEAAPGQVFIEGGTFMMGSHDKDGEFGFNAPEKRMTVASFYIDETEVSNVSYKAFLYTVARDSGSANAGVDSVGSVYGARFAPDAKPYLRNLLPDTLVWRKDREYAYNEPYVEFYWSHAGFNMYPVVGVTWYQANEYAVWRSRVVNALRAEDEADLTPADRYSIRTPDFTLPTEAQWEYAARGGNDVGQHYPWEGMSVRNRRTGQFLANYKMGPGDYGGRSNQGGRNKRMPAGLNDAFFIPAPVRAFVPNDFGVYNMAGNVTEWTLDTYRQGAYDDVEDLNPFRRSDKLVIDPARVDLDSNYRSNAEFTAMFQPNDRYARRERNPLTGAEMEEGRFDKVKVIRGGSWADLAPFLNVGVRRFAPAGSTSSTVGFRCAMVRVGKPS